MDYEGLLSDFRNMPDGSAVILHACAHNPSGVDPTKDQWREILTVFQEKGLLPWFDNAYQGFVSGDPAEDAFAVRLFVASGLETIVACSFAKNFGVRQSIPSFWHIHHISFLTYTFTTCLLLAIW